MNVSARLSDLDQAGKGGKNFLYLRWMAIPNPFLSISEAALWATVTHILCF